MTNSKGQQMTDTSEERTYWNYELTPARKVRVIVGHSPVKTWWCAELEGTERAAVEVNYYGKKFYLDNEDGSGWNKVTHGRGGPERGHSSLPVHKVLEPAEHEPCIDPSIEAGTVAMLCRDNAKMREAGCNLAEAAARVVRDHDGLHRLSIAIGAWFSAIANEGDRDERHTAPADTAALKEANHGTL